MRWGQNVGWQIALLFNLVYCIVRKTILIPAWQASLVTRNIIWNSRLQTVLVMGGLLMVFSKLSFNMVLSLQTCSAQQQDESHWGLMVFSLLARERIMEDSLLGWWSSDLVLFHFPDELMFIFFFFFFWRDRQVTYSEQVVHHFSRKYNLTVYLP